MKLREGMLVKVCGVANIDDAVFASRLGADIIGVVLDPTIPRHGDTDLVTDIHRSGIRVAGVYTSLESALGRNLDEDLIQLHFPHDGETVEYVKNETGKEVISVIQYSETNGLSDEARARYSAGADIVLIENRNGMITTLDRIAEIQKIVRTGISGRISPGNALEFARINPLMIDLSSSLELYPGKKDPSLVSELFRNLEVA
ncbi:hypothetical protein IX51_11705 [uncultured archaeon]|nr:hypothetical protein IX51_11705 [uncultured archaeon]